MKKLITDREIETIIKKDSIHYIKHNHTEHFKALQLGAFAIKNNINDLEQLETLINIKDRLLSKD